MLLKDYITLYHLWQYILNQTFTLLFPLRQPLSSALYAAVRIPAERFCVIGTKFPVTQKIHPPHLQCKGCTPCKLIFVRCHDQDYFSGFST